MERAAALATCLVLLGAAPAQAEAVVASERTPVLLVHGILDNGRVWAELRERLLREGPRPIHALDLHPNSGSAGIEELALQVDREARLLQAQTGAARIDLVGFSMGALVSRYWMQVLGGRERVRVFVSISGPQAGTLTATLAPGRGVAQMRPGSELLRHLAADLAPWGQVRVHAFWTPFDLMILPARSSRLPGAAERTFPVLLHQWMLTDPRVLEAVAEALGPDPSPQ